MHSLKRIPTASLDVQHAYRDGHVCCREGRVSIQNLRQAASRSRHACLVELCGAPRVRQPDRAAAPWRASLLNISPSHPPHLSAPPLLDCTSCHIPSALHFRRINLHRLTLSTIKLDRAFPASTNLTATFRRIAAYPHPWLLVYVARSV